MLFGTSDLLQRLGVLDLLAAAMEGRPRANPAVSVPKTATA
jgi:hypothetical protein